MLSNENILFDISVVAYDRSNSSYLERVDFDNFENVSLLFKRVGYFQHNTFKCTFNTSKDSTFLIIKA